MPNGITFLHAAAWQESKEVVVCLVEELRADVNQMMAQGWTPLMLASGMKHDKIVTYLLKKGADAQKLQKVSAG
jgi:ankyrin repeat protein